LASNSERRVEILRYVMDRQKANQRTTKSEVIRHMRGMSAINTTHHLIMDLIKEGKLNVEKLNSQVHFLNINEKYDLPQFERELLVQAIAETHSYFENISRENKGLVAFLKKVIYDDDLRSTIEYLYIDIDIPGISDSEFKKRDYDRVFKEKSQKKTKPK
jgi:hypothetical protein